LSFEVVFSAENCINALFNAL